MRSRIALLTVLALAAAATAPAGDWNLQGNAGTQAGDFLGTTDARPLDLRVNNQRARRFEYNSLSIQRVGLATATTASVIGGDLINSVTWPVNGQWPAYGATIGGGGLRATDVATGAIEDAGNFVGQAAGTIGGGIGNRLGDYNCALSVDCYSSTIAGGQANSAGVTYDSAVGGGVAGEAAPDWGTVGGGTSNPAAAPSTVPRR